MCNRADDGRRTRTAHSGDDIMQALAWRIARLHSPRQFGHFDSRTTLRVEH
jgi:hypothetical protein